MFGPMMAILQPEHVALKLTTKFCHTIDYIVVLLASNNYHFKFN